MSGARQNKTPPSAGGGSEHQNCISGFRKKGMTGAEIPVTLLFVDIRGSTALGERLTPTAFRDYWRGSTLSGRSPSSSTTGWSTSWSATAPGEHEGVLQRVLGQTESRRIR